jgi:DNA polymerase-3 subunit epsilon
MREIAFDTETTGLDPKSGHKIVEIGCVELINHLPTGNVFHKYINPERDIPVEAFRVHGLSEEFLSDKPLFADIADEFLTFVGDAQLVIHNAAFDMGFINAELAAIGRDVIPMDRAIDTVRMARRKFPGAQASLNALCMRFGIDLSARDLHGALLDAQLLAAVYLELRGGRQHDMGLAAELAAQAKNVEVTETAPGETGRRAPRTHAASPEELARNEEFIQKLNEPIWLRA